MSSLVPVLFYVNSRPEAHLLDELVRAERRHCETPLSIDPNRADDLFEAAGVSREDWAVHVLETHGVSLANPSRVAIRAAYPSLADGYVNGELRRMEEHAELWGADEDEWETGGWTLEEGQPRTVTPEQLDEVISQTLGRGLVAIHFMADADELREAVAEDNEITLASDALTGTGLMFGLYDPANGAGHMVEATGAITIRPSLAGRMVVGTEEILDLFGTDASALRKARISVTPGGPLMVSSRGDMVDRLPPPDVDLSPLDSAPSRGR